MKIKMESKKAYLYVIEHWESDSPSGEMASVFTDYEKAKNELLRDHSIQKNIEQEACTTVYKYDREVNTLEACPHAGLWRFSYPLLMIETVTRTKYFPEGRTIRVIFEINQE